MKRNFIVYFILLIFFVPSISPTFCQQRPQETITITTYYPAPSGAYQSLQLFPANAAPVACNVNTEGTLYYDSGLRQLLICQQSAGVYNFQPIGGFWTLDGTNLYPNNNNWNVGIGTTSPQGALDVTSTTSGLIPPRMTTVQRDNIQNPINGMAIYNTENARVEIYKVTSSPQFAGWISSGIAWVKVNGCTPFSISCWMPVSNNVDATTYCQQKGYTVATGACKCDPPANNPIQSNYGYIVSPNAQGSLITVKLSGTWNWACMYGSGGYTFTAPTYIACSN